MTKKINKLTDAQFLRMKWRLYDLAMEKVSKFSGYINSVDIYEVPKSQVVGAAGEVLFRMLNGRIYLDVILLRMGQSQDDMLTVLAHELGHCIDFFVIPPELRCQISPPNASLKTPQAEMGALYESERRAWSEGLRLFKELNFPAWLQDSLWRRRSMALDSAIIAIEVEVNARTARKEKEKNGKRKLKGKAKPKK